MSLIKHFNEKFGMVTVLDATFYDTDGNPLAEFDTLTVSNINAEGEEKEIRGGQGADLLMQYDYGRTAEVEITDALLSMGSLKYLWGTKDAVSNFQYLGKVRFTYDGANEPSILDSATITKVIEFDEDGSATELQEATGEYPYTEGKDYLVYYKADSDGSQKQLTLTSRDFPPVVHFVGDTFVIDKHTGKRKHLQIDIPRLKLGSNFEFTLEAEGDASTFDFSGVALAHRGNVMHMQDLGFIDED